ncbi:MAG: AIPR family protein [Verrucomicrobia bacterium]|nr:AIPR family protein [Verrucomicrobiota bacterium]
MNGAQTVTTLAGFLKKNEDNPKLKEGRESLNAIRVLCKIITNADQKFVTRVTVNNNRQNPVEPWNLHANDIIQLDLQEKFVSDVGIYYERQENAFDQLSPEDLEDYGIQEDNKAIQMLKLTQTLLVSDGQISRLSDMRRVFEDERVYDQVFKIGRLKADSRHIVLCYKAVFRLRKLSNEIEQKGQNKYWFVSRSRLLLWALICQGLLNHEDLEELAQNHGTNMSIPADYTETLSWLATARVRLLLSDLMEDRDYAEKVDEGNLSFLRTDKAFEKCMENAFKKWRWLHKKLQ